VIAIPDEVRLAELVHLDRRQVQVFVVGAVDAQPAAPGGVPQWQECAVEVSVAADAADDLVDWHLTQAAIVLRLGA